MDYFEKKYLNYDIFNFRFNYYFKFLKEIPTFANFLKLKDKYFVRQQL